MSKLQRVGLVGGGVIGAGWAARFLLNGCDVAVFDPDPELGRKLEAVLANARRAQSALFPGLAPNEGRLTIRPSVEAAVGRRRFRAGEPARARGPETIRARRDRPRDARRTP